ncbi:hypothetical protein ACEWY4_021868 [Coilia grayii]|uniref:Ig-like domain-containing protein n=1 Tax=Coilia grayii TaxID=363190 RepID=A0ABD1J6X0_9TELE
MASIPCVLTVLLTCMSLEHMGVHGNPPTVFSSVGGSATLPCSNVVYPSCSSTTWLKSTSNQAVGLVEHGKITTGVPQHNRLRLASYCALHLANVTTEDAGLYICEQYLTKGENRYGDAAEIYLSVLPGVKPTFSSSSSSKYSSTKTTTTTASANPESSTPKADPRPPGQRRRVQHTERSGPERKMASIPCALTVLLVCLSLNYMGVHGDPPTVFSSVGGSATLPCSNVVYPNCSSTTWLKRTSNEAVGLVEHGKIKTDVPQHNRLRLASNCALHLANVTTEDAGLYTCEQYLTKGEQQFGDAAGIYLSVLPGAVMAGVGVCVCLLAAALIAVVVIRKRRASRTTATAMQSVQPPQSSADAELHYAAFQHLNPTQAGPAAKQSNDTVTYSSIMQQSGGEDQSNSRPVDPSAVYATVQKNNNTHN